MNAPSNVAELTIETLIANGIDQLYCLPGVQNDHFFYALYDRTDALKPIQSRHEQGAAYMAMGAALATGKMQAFCVVPGPGFLNAAAALSTAYAVNAPVLAIVGQIPLPAGLGLMLTAVASFGLLRRRRRSDVSGPSGINLIIVAPAKAGAQRLFWD